MANKQAMMLTIDKLLRQIAEEQEKRGADASSKTAPASDEGPRSAEHAKDVKEQVGPASTESDTKAKAQEQVQPEGGALQTVTEGPGSQEAVKTDQKDPGTASPAKVATFIQQALESGNKLIEMLAGEIAEAQTKAAAMAGTSRNAQDGQQAQKTAASSNAGDSAVGASESAKDDSQAKTADGNAGSNEELASLVEAVQLATKVASELAEDVAGYLDGFQEGIKEAAVPAGELAGGGEGADEAALLNALAEGSAEPPEVKEAPAEDEDERVEMLASILDELGVTPEDLEAALAAKEEENKSASAKSANKSKWTPKTAEQAAQYRAVRDYIKELVSR